MKLRSYLPRFKDEGRVIAIFGQARLLKYFDGKYEPVRTSEATTPRGTTKPGGWSFACAVVNSDSSLKSCAAAGGLPVLGRLTRRWTRPRNAHAHRI